MKYTKKDLQRAIEHIVCYTINDISMRTKNIEKYVDKDSNIIPGSNEIETAFREIMVEDYGALMQRYAVNLQPIFEYIEKELPMLKDHITPLRSLYQRVLDNGSFKNGCNCLGCKRYKEEPKK